MKRLLISILLMSGIVSYAQEEKLICNELPIANPQVKAVCTTSDLGKHFGSIATGDLSKGSHSATYKIYVDCNGEVKELYFQRGNFSAENQKRFELKIKELTWKAAENKSKSVTSVVFMSIEIVNAQVNIVIQ